MIRVIDKIEECLQFLSGYRDDPNYTDPMIGSEEQIRNKLLKSIKAPDSHSVLGIFRNDEMIGLFAFLVLGDECYLEMLVGLCRDEEAYQELFIYLKKKYAGFQADFVFNPSNDLLAAVLKVNNALFDTEQQKMVYKGVHPAVDTQCARLISAEDTAQYCSIHNKDMYWTGEKVLAAQDRFRTIVAVEEEKVVGYLDVTHSFEENEPFDIFVLEEYRRRGIGRKMLALALELNVPNRMMLQVDIDNNAAIRLYSSMGFQKADGENIQTVHWTIPVKGVL